jgi:hypothetical protein
VRQSATIAQTSRRTIADAKAAPGDEIGLGFRLESRDADGVYLLIDFGAEEE